MKNIKVGILVISLLITLMGCGANSFIGTYEKLNGEYTYKFIATENNQGTFEKYENGRLVDVEEYKRNTNTWEQMNDVLILNNGKQYFKIYKDCIVYIDDKDDEPIHRDYIAPKGNKFNYKIGNVEFFEDGSCQIVTSLSNMLGEYYRNGNIIYTKYAYENEFKPGYYIYDNDHIIDAGQVLVKE